MPLRGQGGGRHEDGLVTEGGNRGACPLIVPRPVSHVVLLYCVLSCAAVPCPLSCVVLCCVLCCVVLCPVCPHIVTALVARGRSTLDPRLSMPPLSLPPTIEIFSHFSPPCRAQLSCARVHSAQLCQSAECPAVTGCHHLNALGKSFPTVLLQILHFKSQHQ